MRVTVPDFEYPPEIAEQAESIQDSLTEALARTPGIEVVDQPKIDKALGKQALRGNDNTEAVMLGRNMSSAKVILGSVARMGTLQVSLKFVDVALGTAEDRIVFGGEKDIAEKVKKAAAEFFPIRLARKPEPPPAKKPAVQKPIPAAKKPLPEPPAAKPAPVEPPEARKPADVKPAAEKPVVKPPPAEKPAVKPPVAEKPVPEPPAAAPPKVDPPAAKKPARKQPAVKKPAEEPPGEDPLADDRLGGDLLTDEPPTIEPPAGGVETIPVEKDAAYWVPVAENDESSDKDRMAAYYNLCLIRYNLAVEAKSAKPYSKAASMFQDAMDRFTEIAAAVEAVGDPKGESDALRMRSNLFYVRALLMAYDSPGAGKTGSRPTAKILLKGCLMSRACDFKARAEVLSEEWR